MAKGGVAIYIQWGRPLGFKRNCTGGQQTTFFLYFEQQVKIIFNPSLSEDAGHQMRSGGRRVSEHSYIPK